MEKFQRWEIHQLMAGCPVPSDESVAVLVYGDDQCERYAGPAGSFDWRGFTSTASGVLAYTTADAGEIPVLNLQHYHPFCDRIQQYMDAHGWETQHAVDAYGLDKAEA